MILRIIRLNYSLFFFFIFQPKLTNMKRVRIRIRRKAGKIVTNEALLGRRFLIYLSTNLFEESL